jgi:hypothetical protein
MIPKNSMAAAVAALSVTFGVSAALAQTAATVDPTGKWQSVAKTDAQEAFVNLGSIVAVGAYVDAKVKQNYAQPQPAAKKDKTYLSSRNVYRFDCAQRKVGMKEIRTFPQADLMGDAVDKAKFGDKNVQWVDAQERTVFGELLDFVCKAPAATPAG